MSQNCVCEVSINDVVVICSYLFLGLYVCLFLFFFNDTATTEIYTYDTLFPYTTLFRSLILARHDPDKGIGAGSRAHVDRPGRRSEEHTSELQSLMRISYAVFCLKKKNNSILPTQHSR